MSDAVGILWIQDGATYGTSDNRNLSLFLRGMLLDDEARELLPPWAGFIGGVIESSKLTRRQAGKISSGMKLGLRYKRR